MYKLFLKFVFSFLYISITQKSDLLISDSK